MIKPPSDSTGDTRTAAHQSRLSAPRIAAQGPIRTSITLWLVKRSRSTLRNADFGLRARRRCRPLLAPGSDTASQQQIADPITRIHLKGKAVAATPTQASRPGVTCTIPTSATRHWPDDARRPKPHACQGRNHIRHRVRFSPQRKRYIGQHRKSAITIL